MMGSPIDWNSSERKDKERKHLVTGLLLDLKFAQRLGSCPAKGSSIDYID